MPKCLGPDRGRALAGLAVLAVVVGLSPGALAQWVEFVDETATRVSAPSGVFVTDAQEKDYAWGDVDNDGDTDLVIVRKQPYTSAGKRVNYLLLNQNGVLTDRTDDFAVAADVPGDEGFNTPTNDRDVVLADLNLDGWLDIVTATTISDGDAKHIGHPRVYMNLGCTGACNGTADWQGFRYEEARIPTMLSYSGQAGFNPRFCSVHAGDVTNDGYPDLWFGDYDSSGAGGVGQPAGADFNDRLLVNQGLANPGFFDDVTNGAGSRFSGVIQIPNSADTPFPVSAFGAAANIFDINGDGHKDIVKQTSLNAPTYVGAAFNDPSTPGFFSSYKVLIQNAPYFVSVGDLNNDDKLDMVITDDGADRYMLNDGNEPDGRADFTSYVYSYLHNGSIGAPFSAADDGFGGNSVIADLDKDGWNDVLITDVDVDIGGCNRRMHIFRNLTGTPGEFVVLEEQTEGPTNTTCGNSQSNPADCIVASIPSNKLEGVHDVAVFDLNGDTFLDMVVGRCNTSEVYVNAPDFPPAGGIAEAGGTQLTVSKNVGQRIQLHWGASCTGTDSDYSVYEGTIGAWAGHNDRFCTTGGFTQSSPFLPAGSADYYLVVPHNTVFEGSYGYDSGGVERGQGSSSCRVVSVSACE